MNPSESEIDAAKKELTALLAENKKLVKIAVDKTDWLTFGITTRSRNTKSHSRAGEKIKAAWDCIIDAIAYITKEMYLGNGEKYFPEPIEIVDDTVFAHMINTLKSCSPEESEFLENLYKDCLNNQKSILRRNPQYTPPDL